MSGGAHLALSTLLGVIGGVVASYFVATTLIAVLVGVAVFLIYWGIITIMVIFDLTDLFD